MKKLVLVALVSIGLFGSSSYADLAVGGYLGLNQAQPENTNSGSYSGKTGSEIAAFLQVPIFPTLSLRFGLAQKNRKTRFEGSAPFTTPGATATADISENLFDVGLGLQWELPFTGLYVMGGAKISTSQSISCDVSNPAFVMSGCEKTKLDYPVFVGAGYDIVDLLLLQLSIEAEYERGNTANFLGAKNNSVSGRLVGKIGF